MNNSKFVQNLMIDLPNFAENASFLSLLKLSQTSKEMRERLLPVLKAKRIQELKSLQTWLFSPHLNKNYTLEELTHLENLNLSENQITEIPPEIGQLTNLKYLDIYENKIKHIPPEIGLLTNLIGLYLDRNHITKIPPEIGQLINLEDLWLDSNQITEIPPEIGQLTNLKRLYLDHNKITKLPPEIGLLSNLEYLSLSWNQITKIPSDLFGEVSKAKPAPPWGSGQEIGLLTQQHGCNLTKLWLDRNQITEIPPNLKRPGIHVYI